MHHTEKCPRCKELASAIHLTLVEKPDGVRICASRVIPFYCPFCGYPIARHKLIKEAEGVIRHE